MRQLCRPHVSDNHSLLPTALALLGIGLAPVVLTLILCGYPGAAVIAYAIAVLSNVPSAHLLKVDRATAQDRGRLSAFGSCAMMALTALALGLSESEWTPMSLMLVLGLLFGVVLVFSATRSGRFAFLPPAPVMALVYLAHASLMAYAIQWEYALLILLVFAITGVFTIVHYGELALVGPSHMPHEGAESTD
jgi:hypothetical protein